MPWRQITAVIAIVALCAMVVSIIVGIWWSAIAMACVAGAQTIKWWSWRQQQRQRS